MSDLKFRLQECLLSQIRVDLESLTRSQVDTSAAATHAENRSEHAKDTRATEQSYLARGLADRVAALTELERRISGSAVRVFSESDQIEVGALVEIEDQETGESQHWWLVPDGGGRLIDLDDEAFRTVTPTAPLGGALLGLRIGEEGSFSSPRGLRTFEVRGLT